MPTFSVIVSVYNIEMYLSTCIKSILNQDYKDFELLLINDGSTDSSRTICYDYADKYPYIRVIDQQNQGISAARNTGIRNATGDYLYFIDGDDYINKNTLSSFVEIINQNPNVDFIIGRMSFFIDGTTNFVDDTWLVDPRTVSGKDGQDAFASIINNIHYFMAGIRGVYRREYILNNQVFFDNKLKFSEDLDFSYQLYLTAKSVESNPHPYYYYRKGRPGSLVNTLSLDKANLTLSILANWFNKLEDHNLSIKPLFVCSIRKNIQDRYINYFTQYPPLLAKSDVHYFFKKIYACRYILKHSDSIKHRILYCIISSIGPSLTYKALSLYLKAKGSKP